MVQTKDLEFEPGTTRYLRYGNDTICIIYCSDGLWRDNRGTIYALASAIGNKDSVVRCGIGWLSLPKNDPLNKHCKCHDYQYTSPAYQLFHTRKEADEALYNAISHAPGWRKFLALPFYVVVRLVGGFFWENEDTNKNR